MLEEVAKKTYRNKDSPSTCQKNLRGGASDAATWKKTVTAEDKRRPSRPTRLMPTWKRNPSRVQTGDFQSSATIRPFGHTRIPPLVKHTDVNGDLLLASFRPVRYIWDGEQRRCIATHIGDATSVKNHVVRATRGGIIHIQGDPPPASGSRRVHQIHQKRHV